MVALHPEGVDRNAVNQLFRLVRRVALHPEGVDRNPSVRLSLRQQSTVALHPEGVDRNRIRGGPLAPAGVALHPEGVDRNAHPATILPHKTVALHPEGVDRNWTTTSAGWVRTQSPSTRRAWIEIR